MEEKTAHRPGERILIWFLLFFGVFVFTQAVQMKGFESLSSPGAFPVFISLVMIGTSASILWKDRKQHSSLKLREELGLALSLVLPNTVLIYIIILILYIFSLTPLHFFVSSYLFLVGSFIFLKGTSIWWAFFVAAGMLGAIYILFQYIFKVILW